MRIAILGRVDDMLLVKGVNVFPSAVRDVVITLSDKVTGSVRIVKDGEGEVARVDNEQRTENPRVSGRLTRAIYGTGPAGTLRVTKFTPGKFVRLWQSI